MRNTRKRSKNISRRRPRPNKRNTRVLRNKSKKRGGNFLRSHFDKSKFNKCSNTEYSRAFDPEQNSDYYKNCCSLDKRKPNFFNKRFRPERNERCKNVSAATHEIHYERSVDDYFRNLQPEEAREAMGRAALLANPPDSKVAAAGLPASSPSPSRPSTYDNRKPKATYFYPDESEEALANVLQTAFASSIEDINEYLSHTDKDAIISVLNKPGPVYNGNLRKFVSLYIKDFKHYEVDIQSDLVEKLIEMLQKHYANAASTAASTSSDMLQEYTTKIIDIITTKLNYNGKKNFMLNLESNKKISEESSLYKFIKSNLSNSYEQFRSLSEEDKYQYIVDIIKALKTHYIEPSSIAAAAPAVSAASNEVRNVNNGNLKETIMNTSPYRVNNSKVSQGMQKLLREAEEEIDKAVTNPLNILENSFIYNDYYSEEMSNDLGPGYKVHNVRGDGNCYIACVMLALGVYEIKTDPALIENKRDVNFQVMVSDQFLEEKQIASNVRSMIANYAKVNNLITDLYRAEKNPDERDKYLQAIKNENDFIALFLTDNYYMSAPFIAIMQELFGYQTIFVRYFGEGVPFGINCDETPVNKNFPNKFILILHTGVHFELITFNNQSVFTYSELPASLLNRIKENCFDGERAPKNTYDGKKSSPFTQIIGRKLNLNKGDNILTVLDRDFS